MRIMLETWGGEDGNGFALVDMTMELRQKIFACRELFQMVKTKMPDLEKMTFPDGHAYFYVETGNLDPSEVEDGWGTTPLEPLLTEREYARFKTKEVLLVDDTFGDNLDELAEDEEKGLAYTEKGLAYTECEVLIIAENGFYWEATTDTSQLSTASIRYDDLSRGL